MFSESWLGTRIYVKLFAEQGRAWTSKILQFRLTRGAYSRVMSVIQQETTRMKEW